MKKYYLILSGIFCIGLWLELGAQVPFTGKPMYNIYTTRGGSPLGSFTVELFPNIAPKHTRNFDSLVNLHFFDTIAFHRCIPGFMIQGGDPNSRHGPMSTWGYGQAGQTTVPAEFSVAQHKRGILSAARQANNINSATSQFFINVVNNLFLDGNYSIYGRVLKGMNWVDTIVNTPKLAAAPSSYSSMPLQKIEMFVTYIGSNDTIPPQMILQAPPNHTVGIDSSSNLQLKWTAESDGIIYEVQVSRDSTFSSDTVQYTKSPNAFVYCVQRKGNTRYFWRARSNNGGHFSPWSETWDFHTAGETTGLSQSPESPETLYVYPNPSKDRFMIRGLKTGSRLELFSVKGELLQSDLINATEYAIDLQSREKGIYLLKIKDANGRSSQFSLIRD
ncbi:MAG TPA: peptidylprolyl isomerase [Bacteroidia bacterium]|nr:peptidylprolyl isomerase [Bacteroidia bacterium]